MVHPGTGTETARCSGRRGGAQDARLTTRPQAAGGQRTLLARATKREGAIVPSEADEREDHSLAMHVSMLWEKTVADV